MTLDLTCQACDSSFELDVAELLDEPRIQCPSCDARAPLTASEGLSDALDGLLAQVARLRSRFGLVFEVDSDDLPPPYEAGAERRPAAEDEGENDEDAEADEGEDGDDEDLDDDDEDERDE